MDIQLPDLLNFASDQYFRTKPTIASLLSELAFISTHEQFSKHSGIHSFNLNANPSEGMFCFEIGGQKETLRWLFGITISKDRIEIQASKAPLTLIPDLEVDVKVDVKLSDAKCYAEKIEIERDRSKVRCRA